MKIAKTVFLLLVFSCTGCTVIDALEYVHNRNGPGVDSPEFYSALDTAVGKDHKAVANLANWHGNSYGFDNINDAGQDNHGAAGIFAVTDEEAIFFVWGSAIYVPVANISRSDLKEVIVESMGKNRRLVLITWEGPNTFEFVKPGRWAVDVEGTESVRELLAKSLSP